MKKLLALLLVMLLVVPSMALAADTYEIALVTDVGNIDDQSFNQSAWEGVVAYATANNKTYAYFRPTENSTDSRVESIKAAIEKGAKIVVLPGYLFEEAVTEIQGQYPDVIFISLDTNPIDPTPNTYSIYYQEEQAGYFAGFAAVCDGYSKLGFLGGMAVPAVVRYGYGFVQGCNDAAQMLGITVDIKYWYGDTFGPSDDIKIKMSGWYTEGTEVVFACGGGIYLSAVAAANEADGKVIGVDTDQFYVDDCILTSAMKGLKNSVVYALTAIYDNGGALPADMQGTVATLGAADNAVGLPTAETSWRFANYTVEEYNDLFALVIAGEVVISAAIDAPPAVTNAVVDYQQ